MPPTPSERLPSEVAVHTTAGRVRPLQRPVPVQVLFVLAPGRLV